MSGNYYALRFTRFWIAELIVRQWKPVTLLTLRAILASAVAALVLLHNSVFPTSLPRNNQH
jgi:hypothetical protein